MVGPLCQGYYVNDRLWAEVLAFDEFDFFFSEDVILVLVKFWLDKKVGGLLGEGEAMGVMERDGLAEFLKVEVGVRWVEGRG